MKNGRFIFFLLFFILVMSRSGFGQNLLEDSTAVASYHFQDNWLGEDKAHHFILSFMLTFWGTMQHDLLHHHGSDQAIRAGTGFSFALGLAKEVRDSRIPNNQFSLKDLTADLLGIGLAIWLMNRILYIE